MEARSNPFPALLLTLLDSGRNEKNGTPSGQEPDPPDFDDPDSPHHVGPDPHPPNMFILGCGGYKWGLLSYPLQSELGGRGSVFLPRRLGTGEFRP